MAENLTAEATISSVRQLQRKSLAEQVADQLRDLILLEKLEPGAMIPERDTADALGVSRTPLRESLRLLAGEGLIDIAPNRPPRVANPTPQELLELIQVQGTLEALAGQIACDVASDEELAEVATMEKTMNSLSPTAEPLEFFQHDMNFHSRIVELSGNTALRETHARYNARLWRARFISSRRRVNRNNTLKQHKAIAKALLTRDADTAAVALKSHLDTGYSNIMTALQEKSNNSKGHR